MIDTTGRTLVRKEGKSRPTQYTTCNAPTNHLQLTDHGLAPAETHTGLAVAAHGRKHLQPTVNPNDGFRAKTGKRAIHMEHEGPQDLVKRQTGRYGLKKIATPTRNDGEKHREKAHLGSNMTCEERAIQNLRQAIYKDPTMAHDLEPAIERGGHAALQKEAHLRRIELLAERRAREARGLEMGANQKRPRTATDLGTQSNITKPYATFGRDGDRPPAGRAAKRPLSGPQTKHVEHHGKRIHVSNDEIPFDTVDASAAKYPNPPAIGKTPKPAHGKRGCAEPGSYHADEKADVDSLSVARAKARCGAHANQPFPDFVLGNPPPPARRTGGQGNSSQIDFMAKGTTKAPVAAQHAKWADVKYKKTALW